MSRRSRQGCGPLEGSTKPGLVHTVGSEMPVRVAKGPAHMAGAWAFRLGSK